MDNSIDKLKTYHVGGVSPEFSLMNKINELIDAINELNKKSKRIRKQIIINGLH